MPYKANGRRSVTGIAVTLDGTIVSHAGKTQQVFSLPTTEAEYISTGGGVEETIFAGAVLSFIAPETDGTRIKVLEENQEVIAPIQNPLSAARSNHIDVRFIFVRGLFKSGKIAVDYVPTADKHANLLTKA